MVDLLWSELVFGTSDELNQTHVVLHREAANSWRGLGLVSFDLLVGVLLSGHGWCLNHILLLDHL